MPKLLNVDTDEIGNFQSAGTGGFKFSGVRPENLGATEYTLVTIAVDVTGSVDGFKDELLNAIKSIIEGCKKSPRAENLLIRIVKFNSLIGIMEIHGFKLLSMIDINNDYEELDPDGLTNLYDAVYETINAELTYAKTLIDQDFGVNGAIYIITDGADNKSNYATSKMIKSLLDKTKKEEDSIESLISILIGVNASSYARLLNKFKTEANLTQFVDIGDATPQRLAKLAAFVSKSVSSQSQSLGTGAPSQPISF